jgi:hypothetical protein
MRSRIAAGLALAAGHAGAAHAEIHDYMILRLLYLGTSCGVQKLDRLEAAKPEWRRFKAECRDVSSYPHGIFVTCTDLDDDRHCRIETEAKAFDSLELLRPKGD